VHHAMWVMSTETCCKLSAMRMRTITLAILAVGFLLACAFVYRSHHRQPSYAERSFTMVGETTAACGFLVPYDTRADRSLARGMRVDCGIYGRGLIVALLNPALGLRLGAEFGCSALFYQSA
jgi:hypothetical protein